MVYYFLIDYANEGEYYRVAIEGELEEIQENLYKYSNDVRLITSTPERRKSAKGVRTFPWGIMAACDFVKDKVNTFGRKKSKTPPDPRHHLREDCHEQQS